jgi:hypothetical protein
MSTPSLGTTASRDQGRVLPTGETIGRYTSYLDAQKAVDYLADNRFAVQKVALSYPRVALGSAATGAWFGLFVGLILSLFGGSEMVSTITSSIALGAIFWLLFGVITYAFQRGKRDFTSTSQVIASSYDVIVDPSLAADARRILQQLPMNGQAQHPGAAATGWNTAPGATARPSTPERPASWNDPYGAQQQGQQPAHEQPAAPDQPGTPESQTAGPGTTGPRRGQFPDLPDGRPQYGVRVAEQPSSDQQGVEHGNDGDPGAQAPVGSADGQGTPDGPHGSSSAGRPQQ